MAEDGTREDGRGSEERKVIYKLVVTKINADKWKHAWSVLSRWLPRMRTNNLVRGKESLPAVIFEDTIPGIANQRKYELRLAGVTAVVEEEWRRKT